MRKTKQLITFIDTAVNAAKPIDGRRTEYRLRDTKGYPMNGLVLEVQAPASADKRPRRSWRVHYDFKQGGPRLRRKVSIGDGHTALATIRKRWIEIRDAVQEGRDWVADQRLEEQRHVEAKRGEITFAELVELYMSKHSRNGKNTYQDDERKLRNPILPAIGHLPAQSIKKTQIISIIDSVAFRENGKGAPVQADRIKALISSIYNWGRDEDLVEHNPADRIRARSKRARRERIYSPDEIRLIWHSLDIPREGETWLQFCAIVRIGILTGQRIGEISGARREELEFGGTHPTWRISRNRMKNKRPHNVPLTSRTAEIFVKALDTAGPHSPFVFPSKTKPSAPLHRDTAVHTFADLRDELELGKEANFHAFRHTLRTRLRETLRVPKEVCEHILSHRNPAADISTHYDHGDYDREKRAALKAWEDHVLQLLNT